MTLPGRALCVGLLTLLGGPWRLPAVEFRAEVVDEASGKPLAARVYVQGTDNEWQFVEAMSSEHKAVRYEKVSFVNAKSVEMHTSVPAGVHQASLEWRRLPDGSLEGERELPNRVSFGCKVTPAGRFVQFDLWLRNGSDEVLTDLRVQNCVMLKACAGFSAQTNQNKRLEDPFVTTRSDDGKRWIITAWTDCQRTWANAPVPCMHSDPKFPDCGPGQTQRLRGWLWFYEGDAIDAELARLKSAMPAP